MPNHAVVIAGGGPTGLMLAGELALAGVGVAIVERRASQELVGVLRTTMAHVALRRPDERTAALRDTIAEFLMGEESRRRFAAMMFGLDICYDLGEGHPLLGRRMPDLDLTTDAGPLQVFTLLHHARPVLLNFEPRSAARFSMKSSSTKMKVRR